MASLAAARNLERELEASQRLNDDLQRRVEELEARLIARTSLLAQVLSPLPAFAPSLPAAFSSSPALLPAVVLGPTSLPSSRALPPLFTASPLVLTPASRPAPVSGAVSVSLSSALPALILTPSTLPLTPAMTPAFAPTTPVVTPTVPPSTPVSMPALTLATTLTTPAPMTISTPDTSSNAPGALPNAIRMAEVEAAAAEGLLARSPLPFMHTVDWDAKFHSLFHRILVWCSFFCGQSLHVISNEVLQHWFERVTTRQEIDLLLTRRDSRYPLIAAVFTRWICFRVLTLDFFKGFDQELEVDIRLFFRQTGPDHNPPDNIRNWWLSRMSDRLSTAVSKREFTPWLEQHVRTMTDALDQFIRSAVDLPRVLHRVPPGTEVRWRHDLAGILKEAADLSVIMHTQPQEWKMTFFARRWPFCAATMVNRDPFYEGDERYLEEMCFQVRLCVTPLVKRYDYDNTGRRYKWMQQAAYVMVKEALER